MMVASAIQRGYPEGATGLVQATIYDIGILYMHYSACITVNTVLFRSRGALLGS